MKREINFINLYKYETQYKFPQKVKQKDQVNKMYLIQELLK